MFEELFDLRTTALKRDLVGMEEVKTRLKRKGEEIEDLKRIAAEKKRMQLRESIKRTSSRISSNVTPVQRRLTTRSGMGRLVSFDGNKMEKARSNPPKARRTFTRNRTEQI